MGRRKREDGSGKREAGRLKREDGSRKWEVGRWKREAGSGKWEGGSTKLEVGRPGILDFQADLWQITFPAGRKAGLFQK
ncbi:hypothetical protein OU792_17030 [Algoriphagus sp. NF]|nr:hypothetical protein [Algoriphagus sp. NF]